MKALLAAARRMRQDGLCGCVTVDGPRGPRHEVKEGAIFLAGRAAAPIVPIRLFMTRRKVFRSWDRFQLPWPFSRVAMVCGDAYRFTGDIRDPEQIAAACRELEARLNALQPPKSFLPGVSMSVSSPSSFPEESSRAGFLPRACYRLARILSGLGFSGVRKVGRGLGLLFWTCLPSRRRWLFPTFAVIWGIHIPGPADRQRKFNQKCRILSGMRARSRVRHGTSSAVRGTS